MNYLVGLTGGIGSGKSTAADLFAAHGARIIDTDLISRQLTLAGGAAIPAIRATFGAQMLDADGALNRSRMRELVFGNPAEKQRLEAILHPLILVQARQMAAAPTDAPYTLIVVPLLFETGGYTGWLQRVIVLDCAEDLQVARTVRRSGLDEQAVRAIMTQQLDRAARVAQANEVIHNDDGLEMLEEQVDAMHRRLCILAAESD